MVKEVIGEDSANDILAIPLSRVPTRDKLVWYHTKCGNYITSGYHNAREMKKNGDFHGRAEGGGSRGVPRDTSWQKIWNIKVPPRVKTFLWKCLHNILPTRDRLRRRGILVESSCVFCNNAAENILHNLVTCPISSSLLKEVVGRQTNGDLLGAAFTRLPHISSPLVAECLAARAGMEFAWANGWRRIILKSDSEQRIHFPRGEYRTPCEAEMIIGDSLYLARHMDV
ncbi:hypothetical protein LIER_04420 [Lithospermum erythrorhizon]|uniref:Reverse transcriptase zinc-binding domain-containing protein n=1 Tax=Lithospermum erythrorhizon TaxID=34254 RepID=A0AAV3NWP8_LITER